MSDFFAMGGYAAYVWPSYALALALLLGFLLASVKRYRRLKRDLALLEDKA